MNDLSWNISNDFESKGLTPVEYLLTKPDLIHHMRTMDKMLHPLGIGFYALDRSTGNFLYVSSHFDKISDCKSHELINDGINKWEKMIHPDDRKEIIGSIEKESNIILNEYQQRYYTFNLSYRIISSQGRIKQVLQKGSIYKSISINNNLLEIGMITETKIVKRQEFHSSGSEFKNESRPPVLTPVQHNNNNNVGLSLREKEVDNLFVQGYCPKQISDSLNISVHTVRAHRRKIIEKKKTFKKFDYSKKMKVVTV